MEKIKLGRGEHKLAKKQDLTWKSRTLLFSKSIVAIKSRKIKSEFLLFASLSAKKVSETACQFLEKQENRRNGTCLIFITNQSTCLNSSNAKFILLRLVSSYS